jgi:DNA primase
MNDVEEVKSRLDIVDVISGYVPLKQTGKSFKGLSPFKTEKTPSFIVSTDKNIWHDFSSGKGGDVISFVMEMEGLSFPEALEMLAKRAGVKLKPRQKASADSSSKNKLYDALDDAMKYFHLMLSKTDSAKDYFLKQRKLKGEIIKNYKLGYSPDSWDSLSNYLLKKGFRMEDLITAGLCAKGNKGSGGYDLFRGRVMFPVFDNQGRTIGFSARILGEQKAAKYINTPQTPVYNKSLAIYGLSQAKEAIREKDQVVVVEGNMDVLALANAGFKNIVACSGTALTDLQLKQLSRLTKNIAFCFDADEAGINATLRAIEVANNSDVKIDVISLEGAKDPDELLSKDKRAWQKAVDSAQYAPDFLINYAKKQFGITTAPGKKKFTQFILPMLKTIQDEIELQHYVKKVAQLLDVEEDSIKKMLQSQASFSAKAQPVEDKIADQETPKRKLTRRENLEKELLELCLAFPELLDAIDDLNLENVSELHQPIFEQLKKNHNVKFDDVVKVLPKHANYVRILSLRGEQQYADLTAHDKRLEAFTLIARIEDINKQIAKRQLARQLSQAEADGDTKKSRELLRQYQALLNED